MEGKLLLSAVYTGQQHFKSEYETYHYCLKDLGVGFDQSDARRNYAVVNGWHTTDAMSVARSNGYDIPYAIGVSMGFPYSVLPACNNIISPLKMLNMPLGDFGVYLNVSALFTTSGYSVAPNFSYSTVETFKAGAMGYHMPNPGALSTPTIFGIDQTKKIILLKSSY